MNYLMCCGVLLFVLSIWGIIQLSIMGVLYKIESTSLIHDCAAEDPKDYEDFIKKTKENYSRTAINCWIAAVIYIVMFLLSIFCMRRAQRKEELALQKLQDDELVCDPDYKEKRDDPKFKDTGDTVDK